jgi:hypothetical protein
MQYRIVGWLQTVQKVRSDKLFLVLKSQGTMTSAHALYWEGIVLARVQESWNQDDVKRYQFIVDFFKSRAEYAPSTFRHKAIFLEGRSAMRGLLIFSRSTLPSAWARRRIELHRKCNQVGQRVLHVSRNIFAGVILSLQDAAIFSERLAELYFSVGRERFAHAYLLEALEMWNAMAVDLKVRHLRERYPDILGDVVLPDNKILSPPDSSRESHLEPSSMQTPSSGFIEATSHIVSSSATNPSRGESARGIHLF